MDQLETLIIPSETVEFNGQKLEVRGLGLAHIVSIVRHHRAVLMELYDKAIAGKLEGSVHDIAVAMIEDFVPLASLVIATGMGSPQHAVKAAQLPLRIQAEALEKIITLTLVGEGGLEKLMEIASKAMTGAASLTSLKA